MDKAKKLEEARQRLNHVLQNLDKYSIDDYCEAAKEYTIAEQQVEAERLLHSNKPIDVTRREAAAQTFKEKF